MNFLVISSFLLCFTLLAEPLISKDISHNHPKSKHQAEISYSNQLEGIKLSLFNSSFANHPMECEESEDNEEEKNEAEKFSSTKFHTQEYIELLITNNLYLKQVRLRIFRPPIS
ncbi:hypothetical protein N9N67_02435 [Bacteriovoracaceae bacterium]|nr:hypothetical protein [Bacteriovoracaceae bacterium]